MRNDTFYIVVSGLSASGKTTLVETLGELHSVLVVPEHVDWIGGSDNFPGAPETLEEKKQKQRFFMELDLERLNWAREHASEADVIVSDTDFTAPLAHNFAARLSNRQFDVYEWLVGEYVSLLETGRLQPADLYLYLDVPLAERKRRRREDWPERRRNDMFFEPPFPGDMRRFYWDLMHPSSSRSALACTWRYHETPVTDANAFLDGLIARAADSTSNDAQCIRWLLETLESTV